MQITYQQFLIRDWTPGDRQAAFDLIQTVLAEYGLQCEPEDADQDVWAVEQAYWETGGAFWVVERDREMVGTAGFYPVSRGDRAVEIRKMYLRPQVRGQGLGRFLLQVLEAEITQRGFTQIWIETATVLKEAVNLYEKSGYQPSSGIETQRCDRVYVKHLTQASSATSLLPN
jgi:putative acetyltransferase